MSVKPFIVSIIVNINFSLFAFASWGIKRTVTATYIFYIFPTQLRQGTRKKQHTLFYIVVVFFSFPSSSYLTVLLNAIKTNESWNWTVVLCNIFQPCDILSWKDNKFSSTIHRTYTQAYTYNHVHCTEYNQNVKTIPVERSCIFFCQRFGIQWGLISSFHWIMFGNDEFIIQHKHSFNGDFPFKSKNTAGDTFFDL